MPGTSVTLDGEWSLLLAACSVNPTDKNLSQEKQTNCTRCCSGLIHWKSLFDLADNHGTLPLLYQALSSLEDAVPADEMRTLKQSYQTNLHKALLLSRELIRIVESLTERGIEVMPYKGLALAEILYGDIALRQSGDIDLLIRPQDFGACGTQCANSATRHSWIFLGARGARLSEIRIRMRLRWRGRAESSGGAVGDSTAVLCGRFRHGRSVPARGDGYGGGASDEDAVAGRSAPGALGACSQARLGTADLALRYCAADEAAGLELEVDRIASARSWELCGFCA